jgi:hypothetical protein
MRKTFRTFLLVIVVAFIGIQFFQPPKNTSTVTESDILVRLQDVPPEIKEVFTKSCYDCHSDNTNYPWYGRIAPVSWMLNKHIVAGKEELNFSEFGNLSTRKKIGALIDVCDVISDGSMPLESYLKLHKDAELSQEQINTICEWVEVETERLFEE